MRDLSQTLTAEFRADFKADCTAQAIEVMTAIATTTIEEPTTIIRTATILIARLSDSRSAVEARESGSGFRKI
jgi:hypothetical protein